MTDFSFSKIEFEENHFKKLNIEIEKSTPTIFYISNSGLFKGERYNRAIRKFRDELEKGLDESTLFTYNEIRYIVNEVALNRDLFNILIEHNKFEIFVLLTKEYKKLSIYKKLFYIYFNYYGTLRKKRVMNQLKIYLKNILQTYNGRNKYLNSLVFEKEYIFINLLSVLTHYNNDYETIKIILNLQDDFEFSKALLNLKILQDLKFLKYDENNQNMFSIIIDKKDMFFDEDKGLSLKEYVVKVLIDRAMKEKQPFSNWQIFILQLIGDPRSTAKYSSAMRSWNIIGESKKEFFIKALSKDDLKLFLEVLSDSVSDTNYHYRKAFWMQFLDKVVFAKIMAGKDAYINMPDEMRKKFKLSNESYSTLKGNNSQSAIYIDFGKIKVLEFTHNGSVRFYNDDPIDLHEKEYTYQFLTIKSSYLIKAIPHNGAKTYKWQTHALDMMNSQLNTNVSKNDIEILEDKQKREDLNKRISRYS